MDTMTDAEIEKYLTERKAEREAAAKPKKLKKKVKLVIEEEVKVEDLVDEIIHNYTPALKKAIYKHREANKERYNEYTREYVRRRMEEPEFARRKKAATKRSNEKVRLRKLAERNALEKKIKIIKGETDPVTEINEIIQSNNGL